MQHSIALMPPPRNFEAPSSFETRIHGRLLLIVRVAWLVVAISCAGLAMVSLPFTFIQIQTVCTGSACSWVQLTPSQVQTLHHLGFSETWYAAVIIAVNVLCIIVTYGFASIVMWSRSGEFMALFFAFLLITCETTPHGASEALVVKVFPVLLIPSQVISFLNSSTLLCFFCLFPNGRFVPRWSRWVALANVGPAFLDCFFYQLFSPGTLLFAIDITLGISSFVFMAGVQFYRYHWVSTPIERQQIKWNLFGLLVQSQTRHWGM